jgi:hypothetical protein
MRRESFVPSSWGRKVPDPGLYLLRRLVYLCFGTKIAFITNI